VDRLRSGGPGRTIGARPRSVFGLGASVAKIVDPLISRFLLRLTLRTNTDLDDPLVQWLHRPVFVDSSTV